MSLSLVGPAIRVGERVRIPHPVPLPCGRRVPTGTYTVLAVDVADGRTRVVVEVALDTSRLPAMYRMPTLEERESGKRIPFACLPTRVVLLPGDFTAYADGDGPLYIPD